MYILGDKFEFKENIDKELIKNKDNLTIMGKKFTLDDIHNALPIREEKLSALIDWSMCQELAIGYVDIVNEELSLNKTIDLNKLLTREEPYSSIDYVNDNLFKDIEKQKLKEIYNNRFLDILERSPITDFFARIDRLKNVFDSFSFIFNTNVSGLNNLMEDLHKLLFPSKCNFTVLSSHSSLIKYYLATKNIFDLYVVCDAGSLYMALLDQKIPNKSIITNLYHNNIDPYLAALYVNEFSSKNYESTPLNITILFLKELKENNNET
jgi:hypothetical protein